MEMDGKEARSKRQKPAMEEKKVDLMDEAVAKMVEKEESETHVAGSDEMELQVNAILEKIESFTQLVSELLESGKTMFKELSNDFEERLIAIHKEQMEKWQEEIKDIRMLDVSNEEVNAILLNARDLLEKRTLDIDQGH
ncbi:hypothetical protein MLD38_030469 [Melastoma candidum]|uniref:Uncharacterized protein n=1 Tax=Melastoma candidum TaxID=119954 RepID=A0ACB9MRZ2_9MYRT|nr:hypothetical protein MLD38_030469 [Melastoma candidum]